MEIIKVAVFEDNNSRRDLLQLLLNSSEGFICTGAYEDCSNVLSDIRAIVPDVVLMDIDMPNVNGIEGLKIIKKHFPEVKILMQTIFEDEDKIFSAIITGADGYILKKTPPAKLLDSILEVMQGGAPMSPLVARQVLLLLNNKHSTIEKKDFDLTVREQEILKYLVQGFSYKMIAEKCNISYPTVNSHISHIYEKMHVSSGTEAVVKAIKHNIVSK
ncbi:MAG TPA: response regulator transcription factor [Bacteroidia bacterium]|nr:response regulator transcription factor [Bacteroidia bacterium]HNT79108.1 response regulator transcription factor [Bacteroidia bacterium]